MDFCSIFLAQCSGLRRIYCAAKVVTDEIWRHNMMNIQCRDGQIWRRALAAEAGTAAASDVLVSSTNAFPQHTRQCYHYHLPITTSYIEMMRLYCLQTKPQLCLIFGSWLLGIITPQIQENITGVGIITLHSCICNWEIKSNWANVASEKFVRKWEEDCIMLK